MIIAHTFVSIPFYVLSVEGALRSAGEEYDAVAATLGADRWTTFRRVTLPLALPGVLAGAALAWARSLGEFGATITFAGNYPGTTQTMPSLIYTELQSDPLVARTVEHGAARRVDRRAGPAPQPMADAPMSGLELGRHRPRPGARRPRSPSPARSSG